MAIAFDKAGFNQGSGFNASVSLAAAASTEVAIIFIDFDSADTVSSVTVNGSATGITQVSTTFTSARQVNCYYLVNPPTSSVAYSVTTTGADGFPNIYVQLYSGVSQSVPIDSNNTGTALASSSITLSTTVVATNCWLVSYYNTNGVGTGTITGGTGTTPRNNPNNSRATGDSSGTVGTGSQSMGWNGSRVNSYGFIISIAPTAAGPTGVKTWGGVTQSTGIKTYEGVALASTKSVIGVS